MMKQAQLERMCQSIPLTEETFSGTVHGKSLLTENHFDRAVE